MLSSVVFAVVAVLCAFAVINFACMALGRIALLAFSRSGRPQSWGDFINPKKTSSVEIGGPVFILITVLTQAVGISVDFTLATLAGCAVLGFLMLLHDIARLTLRPAP